MHQRPHPRALSVCIVQNKTNKKTTVDWMGCSLEDRVLGQHEQSPPPPPRLIPSMMSIIPVLKRHRWEHLEFKFILGYTANSRPARDTRDPVSRTNKQTKPRYLVSWSLRHDDSGLEPRTRGPFPRLGLALQAHSSLSPAVLTHLLLMSISVQTPSPRVLVNKAALIPPAQLLLPLI